ncbi:MAG: DUF3850 domain-containing protein [Blautia sp.]|nr:DUF3850 domain-containing protein [Blautia sp.]
MTPSGVSRFMEVYERYSVEGDTPALKEQYREYNFSQLTELLQISEEDQAMFQPEVKRETIREFKAFQKENDGNPENLMNWMKDPEDDFGIAVKEFFRANPEIMDELFASREYAEGDEKGMAELINPSGSMHFRKETRFLIFYGYEKGLMINRFGESPKTLTWHEFFERMKEIFEDIPGQITWKSCFGEEDDQIPGQDSIENHPEVMPPAPEAQDPAAGQPPAAGQEVPEEIGPERMNAPAQSHEMTEEQKYNAEQDRIDRETRAKLREREDAEKMEHLPSDEGTKVHRIRLASSYYDDVLSGRKTFELRKNDRGYRTGHMLEMVEFKEGIETGRLIHADIAYMLEDYAGLEEGYCILGIKVTDYTDDTEGVGYTE